jgi:hypothetical protein
MCSDGDCEHHRAVRFRFDRHAGAKQEHRFLFLGRAKHKIPGYPFLTMTVDGYQDRPSTFCDQAGAADSRQIIQIIQISTGGIAEKKKSTNNRDKHTPTRQNGDCGVRRRAVSV